MLLADIAMLQSILLHRGGNTPATRSSMMLLVEGREATGACADVRRAEERIQNYDT